MVLGDVKKVLGLNTTLWEGEIIPGKKDDHHVNKILGLTPL